MKILTIHEAIKLYFLLLPHLPEIDYNNVEDINLLEFFRELLDKIIKSGRHRDYLDIVMLATGKSFEEIQYLEGPDTLNLLISSFIENDVIRMIVFCRVITNAWRSG